MTIKTFQTNQRTFTENEVLDCNKVQAKTTARGKFSWFDIYVTNFTNGNLVSVVVDAGNQNLVEVPARWVNNFGWGK